MILKLYISENPQEANKSPLPDKVLGKEIKKLILFVYDMIWSSMLIIVLYMEQSTLLYISFSWQLLCNLTIVSWRTSTEIWIKHPVKKICNLCFSWLVHRSSPNPLREMTILGRAKSRNEHHVLTKGFLQMLWAKEVQVQALSCRVCFFFSLKGFLIASVCLIVPSQILSVFWESFLHLQILILSQPMLTNLTLRISLSSLSPPTHRHFLAGTVQKSWHWTL